VNPWQWAKLIADADCVVTNTFHGTVFSILFQKKFASILTVETGNKLNLISELLRLQEHIGREECVDRALSLEPDYDRIADKLTGLRKSAREFLSESLAI
jgi:hypothetical protein